MGAEFKRLEALTLWSTPDKFWIESSKVKTTHLLQVSRGDTLQVSMEPHLGQIPATANKKTIYGVLGIHTLPLGQVLVVITRRHNVGEVRGMSLWQLDTAEIIPVRWRSPAQCDQEPLAIEAHKRCMSLLAETLSTPYFYFSYNGDITNAMQRLQQHHHHQESPSSSSSGGVATATATGGGAGGAGVVGGVSGGGGGGKDAWERMDRRFVWNEFMLAPFIEQIKANANDMHAFLTPVIHGGVFVRRVKINDRPLTWAIITRRSRFRTGTRFWVRGADASGNVANFNETEQIIEVKGVGVASYVQTRGSMPFLWAQTPDIKYKPLPTVQGTNHDNEGVFQAHFGEQRRVYGHPQVCINLIDSKKAEGRLEAKFRGLFNSAAQNAGLVYEFFDFHKECSKMRYDRLSILVDRLAKYDFGYFAVETSTSSTTAASSSTSSSSSMAANSSSSNIIKRQNGVFRTNCMDCLDRTNVVQSLMARESMFRVLRDFGVLPSAGSNTSSTAMLASNPTFDAVFKNTWADHANMVSVQYAGTGALKTDFTRTGKRTKYGLLQDGWNSIIRYYKNNFTDGFRTDGMHFFLGELSTKDVESGIVAAKYRREGAGTFTANLPWVLVGSVVAALLALLLVPTGGGGGTGGGVTTTVVTVVAVCLAMAVVAGKAMVNHNELFVDFPLAYMKNKRMQQQQQQLRGQPRHFS